MHVELLAMQPFKHPRLSIRPLQIWYDIQITEHVVELSCKSSLRKDKKDINSHHLMFIHNLLMNRACI